MSGISVDELVLKVSTNVDPNKFDINKYEDFLDILCDKREYLRESIEETVRFFLSGQYETTSALARENFDLPKVHHL